MHLYIFQTKNIAFEHPNPLFRQKWPHSKSQIYQTYLNLYQIKIIHYEK